MEASTSAALRAGACHWASGHRGRGNGAAGQGARGQLAGVKRSSVEVGVKGTGHES